jgi:hypothetical protein
VDPVRKRAIDEWGLSFDLQRKLKSAGIRLMGKVHTAARVIVCADRTLASLKAIGNIDTSLRDIGRG